MERVIIGRRQIDKIIREKLPVYKPRMEGERVFLDPKGVAYVTVAGGIDAGECGSISGEAIKVYRSTLVYSNPSENMSGTETTTLFPVMLDTYKQIAWVPMEYIHMV
jgi:hypothetical protein